MKGWTKCSNGNPETCWICFSQLRTEIPVLVCSRFECFRFLHACKKSYSDTSIPTAQSRVSLSNIETDCASVSDESAKSLSGVWNIGHDSSCVLGGRREWR